jgi:DNA-binding PadR family transcriptional regulator
MFHPPAHSDIAVDVPAPPRRSRTSTVESLLVMLNLEPMTGYQLRLAISRSVGNFWQESFGQIYPALRAMAADGLLTCADATSGRSGKIYSLTDLGREHLQQWLALPCERQVMRDELLLKLFSGVEAPRGALRQHLLAYRKEIAGDLARYREIGKRLPEAQRGSPALPYFLITLRQGLLKAEALLRWADEALLEVERLDVRPAHGKRASKPRPHPRSSRRRS